MANNLYGQDVSPAGWALRRFCRGWWVSEAGGSVLVGRQRELAEVKGVLRRACDGSGSCPVVRALAGSGKTAQLG
jgi:hypothetical protein